MSVLAGIPGLCDGTAHPSREETALRGVERYWGGVWVSVVDLGTASAGPSEDLGRRPPQDIAAEQSVLGGMMLSKDAIADVVEVVRSSDFYRPAHELIFDADHSTCTAGVSRPTRSPSPTS